MILPTKSAAREEAAALIAARLYHPRDWSNGSLAIIGQVAAFPVPLDAPTQYGESLVLLLAYRTNSLSLQGSKFSRQPAYMK